VTTICTFNPGKTAMKITTIKISMNDLHHIGAQEPETMHVTVIPDRFQFFKMGFGTAKIVAGSWISWLINVSVDLCQGELH
jgi:hypothetical protein